MEKTKAVPYEEMSVRQQVIQDLIDKKVRLSYSTLKKFDSPISIINHLVKKRTTVFIPTEAMVFGSICDQLLFTPDDIDKNFVFTDHIPSTDLMIGFANDMIQLGLEGKEADDDTKQAIYSNWYKKGTFEKTYEKLEVFIEGKIAKKDVGTKVLLETAKDLIGNLKEHNEVDELLDQMVETQKKIGFIYDGWEFIGYLDAYMKGDNILDGKYTKDSNPEQFNRDIYNLKYHLQAGVYSSYLIESGINMFPEYTFLTYDKSYNYSVIKMDRNYINYGIREFQFLTQKMSQMSKYKQFGKSYGFFKKEFTATKPNWARGFDLKGE